MTVLILVIVLALFYFDFLCPVILPVTGKISAKLRK